MVNRTVEQRFKKVSIDCKNTLQPNLEKQIKIAKYLRKGMTISLNKKKA
jgi:hypothetical protein